MIKNKTIICAAMCIAVSVLLPVYPLSAATAANTAPAHLHFVSAIDSNVYTRRLVHEAFRRLGIDISMTLMEMDTGLKCVNAGIYDGICNQVEETESLYDNLIAVPLETTRVKFCAVTLQGDTSTFDSWDDLRGKRVASLTGKTTIRKKMPDDAAAHIEKPCMSLLYDALRIGECDVAIVTDSSYKTLNELVVPGDMRVAGLLSSHPGHIYLNARHAGLIDRITEVLQGMEQDGTLSKIRAMKPIEDRNEKIVLYLSSYSSEMEWEQRLIEGVGNILNPHKDIVFRNITLNSFRNTGVILRETAALENVTVDFMHSPPDAVIVSDNEAMAFLFNNYNSFLPNDIPIVVCGINDDASATSRRFDRYPNIRGITENIAAAQTVEKMLRLFPSSEQIFVINDYSLTGREWRGTIQAQLEAFQSRIRISHNENLPFDDLMAQVAALNERTLILCGFYFLDRDNRYFPQTIVQSDLRSASHIPVFGLLDSSQHLGPLGGRYADAVLHGETAAKLAVEFLKTGHTDEMASGVMERSHRWIFNWNVMQEYGIGQNQIPGDSIILNKPPSLLEINPGLFYTLLASAVAGSILIVMLSAFVVALKKRKDALKRAHRDLRKLIASTPSPIVLLYPKEKIYINANPAWRKLFDVPTSMEITGLKWDDEGMFATRTMNDLIEKTRGTDNTVSEEGEFRTFDGKVFEAMVYLTKIVFDGKDCLLATLRDLSEERARERMLQNAAEKEREANRLKSHFLMNMSHEIRTPMNAIVGIAQLSKPTDPSEKLFESVLQIGQSASVLMNIINGVLDLSLLENGKMVLKPEKTKLSQMIADLDAVVAIEMDAKHIQRSIHPEETIHDTILTDPSRLQQVLMLLISNAVKFTPDGGEISLTVKETEEAGNISTFLFAVADTGIGIEPDKMDRVFGQFEQADDSITRQHGGAGLGLSIAKNIVELMDGEIWVESEVGKGSTFFFTIRVPVIPERGETTADSGGIERSSGENAADRKIDFSGLRVLLVDDVEINRMIAAELLAELGIVTEEAENGRQAVDKVSQTIPGYYDLIFMDLQMPVLDGCNATREIRALRSDAATLPIVAMTANVMPDDIKMLTEAGMNDYVGKPVFMERLIEVIEEQMKSRI